VAFGGQRLGNLPHLRQAQVMIAASGWIVKKDATHQIILRLAGLLSSRGPQSLRSFHMASRPLASVAVEL
jgi:hypothetical protein